MARQRWQEWAENEDNLSVLAAWARAGQTDEEIAKAIGISRSTLSEWKKKHEPIRKALSTGKDFANRLVENSLFKMSLGFHVTVKKVFKVKTVEFGPDGKRKGEKEELQTAEETEYIKPDTRAIMFYLKNKMPNEYREKLLPSEGGEDGENVGMVIMNEAMAGQIKKMMEEEKEKQNAEQR